MPDAVAAKYTGDGTQFVPGIPARDVTADEWAALTDEQRAFALATKLYKEPGASKKQTKKDGEA